MLEGARLFCCVLSGPFYLSLVAMVVYLSDASDCEDLYHQAVWEPPSTLGRS